MYECGCVHKVNNINSASQPGYCHVNVKRVRKAPIWSLSNAGLTPTGIYSSFSVTLTSRLMLNIQNPVLYGIRASEMFATGPNIGPFVTSVMDGNFTSNIESSTSYDFGRSRPPLWYDASWLEQSRSEGEHCISLMVVGILILLTDWELHEPDRGNSQGGPSS